jgi:hypothetical protein
MFLDGYRHYISATILLIFALGGALDPSAVQAVVTFFNSVGIPVGGPTILLLCGLLVAGLKQLQKWADAGA